MMPLTATERKVSPRPCAMLFPTISCHDQIDHAVRGYSDDCELLEIILPAE